MNLLKSTKTTICFYSRKASGYIWPVLGLDIYGRESIELSLSIDSDNSDDCD